VFVCRRDVPAVHLSPFFLIRSYSDAVSAATDLSLDHTRNDQLSARSLPVTHLHQARIGSRSTTVWPHVYLRPGSCRAPGRRARGWSRTVRPHVSLARLCPPRSTVQGQVQADQPYPSPHGRTTFPVSVSRMWKGVCAERESEDSQTNAYRSAETHSNSILQATLYVR